MLSIAHTLISLPFGFYLQNPVLIFVAAFIFHFFADTLLHWNIYPYNFKKYPYLLVAGDVIGGVVITWIIIGNDVMTLPIIAAIAGGNMPDILTGIWDILKKTGHQKYFSYLTPFFTWHDKLQLETTNMWHGLISQIVLAIAAYILIT